MLPSNGLSRADILATLERYRAGDLDWRSGRAFGYVYDPGHPAEAIGKEVYASFLTENGLDPTAFPSLRRLENEVIALARTQAGGGEHACGTFTSGGTESILLAVKAAREWAREHRPEVPTPEMVLPVTAHAAFHKAASYLGVRAVVVPVDPETYRADPRAIEAAITERTVLLVGSAPSYAHGVVDPIPDIARLAERRGLLCHVDACVGGWLLPYFRRLGADLPEFDLRVPGVTSLSMDLHKYAFCPKGASVVLYRDEALRRHQVFACATWSGYSVINQAVQSSKSGGPIAAAWSVLHAVGDDGYLEMARTLRDTTRTIVEGVRKIPGLRVLGRPDMCLVAIAGDGVCVFQIADEMTARSWYVQPQYGRGGSPKSLHLTLGPTHAPHAEAFLRDLTAATEAARGRPVSPVAEQVGTVFRSLDPAQVSEETIGQMMGLAGAGGDALPGKMAEIHQILDALPPPLVERALVAFMGRLFR